MPVGFSGFPLGLWVKVEMPGVVATYLAQPSPQEALTLSPTAVLSLPTLHSKPYFYEAQALWGCCVLLSSPGSAHPVTGSLFSQMWTNVSLGDTAVTATPPASTSPGVSAAGASQAGWGMASNAMVSAWGQEVWEEQLR